MLLMRHFDKTVMNTDYCYYQGSNNWHMDQESTVLWELKTIEWRVTSSRQIFAIYTRLNWKFLILKRFDDVQSS